MKIEVLPWKRAQKYVEIGLADGFFSASWNASRDEFAERSIDIAEQNWTWYTRRDNPLLPTDPDFKQHALVAGTLGSNILAWLGSENYNIVASPPDAKNMLRMLSLRRFDAFMGNEMVVDRLIAQSGEDYPIIKAVERQMPVGVYFSKQTLLNNPKLMNNFNISVAKCRV